MDCHQKGVLGAAYETRFGGEGFIGCMDSDGRGLWKVGGAAD